MRSKPRKEKARRLSYKKNWTSCSTAKTKVRMAPPFLQPFCALRSPFEKSSPTTTRNGNNRMVGKLARQSAIDALVEEVTIDQLLAESGGMCFVPGCGFDDIFHRLWAEDHNHC